MVKKTEGVKNSESKKSSKDSNKKFNFNKFVKKNYGLILAGTLAIVLLSLLVFGNITGKCISDDAYLSEDEIGKAALDFYSELGYEDGEITLAEDVVYDEEKGLYKVVLAAGGYEEQQILYFAKDGDSFTYSDYIFSIDEVLSSLGQQQPQEEESIPATNKPVVDLYVMSFCPYGNLAEETMLPVYELLKDDVDWNVHYIVSDNNGAISSLHGQPEVDQNIREVCVLNEYGLDTFWDFVSYVNNNCGSDGVCWEVGAEELGIDIEKVNTCFENEGTELMKQEAEISSTAGASGSPTLMINDVKTNIVYDYGNSESYKQVICSAFNNEPEECNTVLEGDDGSSQVSGSC